MRKVHSQARTTPRSGRATLTHTEIKDSKRIVKGVGCALPRHPEDSLRNPLACDACKARDGCGRTPTPGD